MDQIDELLTRGVANIIPNRKSLEKELRSGKKLNVYCGFDVTAPHLHIGNAVPLRKLQQFVELGHNVIFLIGDFTTLVGDTSDKDTERPVIEENEIEKNWQNYAIQAGKILDLNKVVVRKNSDWLSKLNFKDVIKLTRRFSLNDFISRELIKKRLNTGGSVNLSEVLYPVMQGYDSYFMDIDIQVGATDQTFNMQAGRTLQKQLRNKESFVMSFNFLTGTDGRKMSKSWSNAIWLDDTPDDIFGKIMSIKDELIDEYFLLATNLAKKDIPQKGQPMQRKKRLAWQVVSELNSPEAADKSQLFFEATFQKKQTPKNVPLYHMEENQPILDILAACGLAASKSEARRLIEQKGVRLNGDIVTDITVQVVPDDLIQVGSRKFVRISTK